MQRRYMNNTKEQKIDNLVEFLVSVMDMDALEAYVRDDLREYYESIEDTEVFNVLYSNIMGEYA